MWENIVLPLGLDNRKVKPREVEDILKKIGLQDKKDAMPSALSGGQKSCVSDFGQTLIMITHDETIAQMADEMIIIEDGKAVRR